MAVCMCCKIWEGEKVFRFALQLEWYGTESFFLRPINSVHIGDVVKVFFLLCSLALKCHLRGPAMGRLYWTSFLTAPFSRQHFLIYTQSEKLATSWRTKRDEYLIVVFVYFLSGGDCVPWYPLKYIGQKEIWGAGGLSICLAFTFRDKTEHFLDPDFQTKCFNY